MNSIKVGHIMERPSKKIRIITVWVPLRTRNEKRSRRRWWNEVVRDKFLVTQKVNFEAVQLTRSTNIKTAKKRSSHTLWKQVLKREYM